MSDLYMVFDVESVGLHGEGFAVGWVVIDINYEIRDTGLAVCPSEKAKGVGGEQEKQDRAWLAANVLPHLPETTDPNPVMVRETFWSAWMEWKAKGARLAADVPWPVEGRFLSDAIGHDSTGRAWEGPYPFLDIASIRMAVGENPIGTERRLPDEEPAHHPLADAKQSARLLISVLRELR